MSPELLLTRLEQYAHQRRLTIGDQLGAGIHGIVMAGTNQTDHSRVAIKIHERQITYQRERDVYLRFQALDVTRIGECEVPVLVNHDDGLFILEMTIVSRPYVLDFAAVTIDRPPEFPPDVMAEWEGEWRERFGEDWPKAQAIVWELERLGIYLTDVSPSNIAL